MRQKIVARGDKWLRLQRAYISLQFIACCLCRYDFQWHLTDILAYSHWPLLRAIGGGDS